MSPKKSREKIRDKEERKKRTRDRHMREEITPYKGNVCI